MRHQQRQQAAFRVLWLAILGGAFSIQSASVGAQTALHNRAPSSAYTPLPGSAERKMLMDTMRGYTLKLLGGKIPGSRGTIIFTAAHLKVHNGWAFAIVAPKSTDARWQGEPLSLLLHRLHGRWNVADAVSYDDAVEGKVSDAEIMRRFRAKHRQAPSDLF